MRLLRDSVRSWRRAPGAAALAVLSLALGLAAVTTFFSIVDRLVLRSLAIDRPGELFVLADEERRDRYVSFPVWQELAARPHLYDHAFAWIAERVDMAVSGPSQEIEAVWATGDAFATLGVGMALGRAFDRRDDVAGAPDGAVAVISHDFWRRQFGGAADVVGRTLRIKGIPVVVVGVASEAFTAFELGARFDIAMPSAVEPLVNRDASSVRSRFLSGWRILVRLAPGTTAAAATSAWRAEQAAIRAATVPTYRLPAEAARFLRSPWLVRPAPDGASEVTTYYGPAVTFALALAVLTLVVTCGNVALVIAANGARRHSELGMRRTLGASRWTVAAHVLVDAFVVCLVGLLAAAVLTSWTTPVAIAALGAIGFELDAAPGLDLRAALVAVGAAVAATIVAGAVPAMAAARVDPLEALRRTSRRHSTFSRVEPALLAAQTAFSMVVVSVGALLVVSYLTLVTTPTGASPEGVLVAALQLERLGPSHDRLAAMTRDVRAAADSVPGVVAAATVMTVPFEQMFANTIIDVPGQPTRPEPDRMVQMNWVSPGFFDVMGVQMIAGRRLDERDRPGAPRAAVVNRRFIERYFAGDLTLPKTIVFPGDDGTREQVEVVGVSADVVYKTLKEPAMPGLQLAEAQVPDLTVPAGRASLLVRADPARPDVVPALSAALTRALPDLSFTLRPFSWYVAREAARERVLAMVATAFVVLCTLLAGLGVFGVAAATVSRRRRELGVRLAVGARPRQIAALLVSQATRVVGFGVAVGLVASWWVSRLVASLLFATEPHSPVVMAASAATLVGASLVAVWWPARQAVRLAPAEVLRVE